jgi:hypothetical protein
VRLKDEVNSDRNEYYNMMFSKLMHFDVAEEDMHVGLLNIFSDRP